MAEKVALIFDVKLSIGVQYVYWRGNISVFIADLICIERRLWTQQRICGAASSFPPPSIDWYQKEEHTDTQYDLVE